MTSHLELNSRAALCRPLAQREPNAKVYWLAEAENWLHPVSEPGRTPRTGQKDAFQQFLDLIQTVEKSASGSLSAPSRPPRTSPSVFRMPWAAACISCLNRAR